MKVADKIRELAQTDEGVATIIRWFITRMDCKDCPLNWHNDEKRRAFLDGKIYHVCPGNCISEECSLSAHMFAQMDLQ